MVMQPAQLDAAARPRIMLSPPSMVPAHSSAAALALSEPSREPPADPALAVLALRLRLSELPRPAGGDHRACDRRRRRAGADADGRRQVAVLSRSRRWCGPGIGIVVSPLIALMKDQVDALRQAGVRAAYLNSTLAAGARRATSSARCARARSISSMSRPSGWCTPRCLDLLARCRARALRHRRGALRLAMGP